MIIPGAGHHIMFVYSCHFQIIAASFHGLILKTVKYHRLTFEINYLLI
jgi:hypothetical protein